MRRGFVFWGVGLVTAGAVALAFQLGYLSAETLESAWRFWPLILVAIGLSIILGRTQWALAGTLIAALVLGAAGGLFVARGGPTIGCGHDQPTSTSIVDGTFGERAEVRLRFDCGQLRVHVADFDGWRVESGRRGGGPPEIDATDDQLTVSSAGASAWWSSGAQRWVVSLPLTTTYELLDVEANAASSELDLGPGHIGHLALEVNAGSVVIGAVEASVEELALGVNAGSATIRIAPTTSLTGELEVNAGSIEVCADADTAIRIVVGSTTAFGTNLEDSGLAFVDGAWTSDGWTAAERRVELTISGNAGSFNLNALEDCE